MRYIYIYIYIQLYTYIYIYIYIYIRLCSNLHYPCALVLIIVSLFIRVVKFIDSSVFSKCDVMCSCVWFPDSFMFHVRYLYIYIYMYIYIYRYICLYISFIRVPFRTYSNTIDSILFFTCVNTSYNSILYFVSHTCI